MAKKKTLAQRIKADPALKAKYLSNPGLRSKLPAQYLTPEQRAMRAQNAYNAAPITPGSTVTNKALALESQNATTVRYGQQDQALAKQLERQQALQRDVGGWYDTYKADLARHAQNTQALGAQAQQQIRGLGNSMRAMDAAGTDPTTADSQASLVRQQMLAGFGSQQASAGAANNQYADLLANVVAPTQGLQARAGAAQRTRDVGDQITALQAEKGAYGAEYRATRTADETKNVLAGAALQLDAGNTAADNTRADAQAAETRRNNAASRSATKGRLDLATGKDARDAAKDATQRKNKTGPYAPAKKKGTAYKPATREAHTKMKTEIDDAQAWIRRLQKSKSKDGKPLSSTAIRDLLSKGVNDTDPKTKKHTKIPKLSKDAINAAYDLVVKGELSQANVNALHRAGLSLKQLGYPTEKQRNKATGKTPDQRAIGQLVTTLRKSKLRP